MIGFVYGQTEYSILENAIHMDDYINHAVENGFSFLTISDLNLHGHYKFYRKCKEHNIKPIIGLEVKIHSNYSHKNCVLLYAKNNIGYSNLMQISTEQELNGVVTDDFIREHSDGLILVSSAVNSDFELLIFKEQYEDALIELSRTMNLCKDFYLGIMPSSFLYESICEDLDNIIKEHNLKVLPVAKCSYLKPEDDIVYLSLLKISESKEVLSFDDFHLKTKEELTEEFSLYPSAFSNLDVFVSSISDDIIKEGHELPKYPNKAGVQSKDYLAALCNKGLTKRLNNTNKHKNDFFIFKA